ncbi:MAG: hypothetical protein ABFR50_06050 [Candidatus Fermentibacteria bacterium]
MMQEKLNRAVRSDVAAVIYGVAPLAAALLLSMLSVFPGLFDLTLTSRLAVYPVCAMLVLFAGRKHIPVWAAGAAALLIILSLTGILYASIPIQGILPTVKWISFGLMIAGAAGIARSIGSRSIWITLTSASILTAAMEILIRSDSIWGNTNRPGALLTLGFAAAVTGAGFRKAWIRISTVILTGIALFLTNFILAWIAAILALLWFFLNPGKKLHPGVIAGVLLAGQIVVISAPGLTQSIAPSLEIRCRTWQTGAGQLLRNLPMGTGTGQSRLTLIQDAGARVQILAGDPEKRIDHLHSDILTPVVEWGAGGLLLICLAGWLIARKKHFSVIEGSLLLCTFPFIAADLPLATPLGALPVALCIGVILSRPSRDRTIHIPLPVLLIPLVAALFWSMMIIRGYSLLEFGRASGMSGAGSPDNAAATLEKASSWIPFEERTRLFLAQTYLGDGMILAAGNAAAEFNSIYPSYWRGWMLQALAEAASGRDRDAADSYLNALRAAPVTLPDRTILALNAAAFPPDDLLDLIMIGEACCEIDCLSEQETAEMAVTRAGRMVAVAEALIESERVLPERMLILAVEILRNVHGSGGYSVSEFNVILLRLREKASILNSERLNSDLQYLPAE